VAATNKVKRMQPFSQRHPTRDLPSGSSLLAPLLAPLLGRIAQIFEVFFHLSFLAPIRAANNAGYAGWPN